ncbi:MAG: class II aldolase/adducin family protein [Bacillota bacterium]
MILEGLRKAVLEAALEMERQGLTRGTSGNVSAVDPESGLVAITPSGIPYSVLAPEDITVIDLGGKVMYGTRKPSSEAPMHCAIYAAARGAPSDSPAIAGGATAIVHTHSAFATAFSVMNRELPPITVPLALLGGVPIVSFQMPGSAELAGAVASKVAEGRLCCLLQNHGVVCAGSTVEKALESAVYVEEGAEVAVYVLSAGGVLSPIPEDIVARMQAIARGGRAL